MPTDNLSPYFNKLRPLIKPIFTTNLSHTNLFKIHLIAAYSKAFEFNLIVHKSSGLNNSFYFTASLRGICEDYITLNYLNNKNNIDVNNVLKIAFDLQLVEFLEIQKDFFAKNHKQQVILSFMGDTGLAKKSAYNFLKKEWKKANVSLKRDNKLPTIWEMANKSGLDELYKYLYAATSEIVHFSPRNLMRTGWGKSNDSSFLFNPKIFSRYYQIFNRFYGGYLFIHFSKSFRQELELSDEIIMVIEKLEEDLLLESRWPELVTPEEMNSPQAERVRLLNLIKKVKLVGKGLNIPEKEVNQYIADLLNTIQKKKK